MKTALEGSLQKICLFASSPKNLYIGQALTFPLANEFLSTYCGHDTL